MQQKLNFVHSLIQKIKLRLIGDFRKIKFKKCENLKTINLETDVRKLRFLNVHQLRDLQIKSKSDVQQIILKNSPNLKHFALKFSCPGSLQALIDSDECGYDY